MFPLSQNLTSHKETQSPPTPAALCRALYISEDIPTMKVGQEIQAGSDIISWLSIVFTNSFDYTPPITQMRANGPIKSNQKAVYYLMTVADSMTQGVNNVNKKDGNGNKL